MGFQSIQKFNFSVSFSNGGKVTGHNYSLAVTTDCLSDEEEKTFIRRINETLISKIHSRDLSLMNFLDGKPITERGLLEKFYKIIKTGAEPFEIHGLELQRDSRASFIYKP